MHRTASSWHERDLQRSLIPYRRRCVHRQQSMLNLQRQFCWGSLNNPYWCRNSKSLWVRTAIVCITFIGNQRSSARVWWSVQTGTTPHSPIGWDHGAAAGTYVGVVKCSRRYQNQDIRRTVEATVLQLAPTWTCRSAWRWWRCSARSRGMATPIRLRLCRRGEARRGTRRCHVRPCICVRNERLGGCYAQWQHWNLAGGSSWTPRKPWWKSEEAQ